MHVNVCRLIAPTQCKKKHTGQHRHCSPPSKICFRFAIFFQSPCLPASFFPLFSLDTSDNVQPVCGRQLGWCLARRDRPLPRTHSRTQCSGARARARVRAGERARSWGGGGYGGCQGQRIVVPREERGVDTVYRSLQ